MHKGSEPIVGKNDSWISGYFLTWCLCVYDRSWVAESSRSLSLLTHKPRTSCEWTGLMTWALASQSPSSMGAQPGLGKVKIWDNLHFRETFFFFFTEMNRWDPVPCHWLFTTRIHLDKAHHMILISVGPLDQGYSDLVLIIPLLLCPGVLSWLNPTRLVFVHVSVLCVHVCVCACMHVCVFAFKSEWFFSWRTPGTQVLPGPLLRSICRVDRRRWACDSSLRVPGSSLSFSRLMF